jgi:hypothetical protein
MDFVKLSSSAQLYEYLLSLSSKLSDAGVPELSEIVLRASRTVSAIPVTEFFGESRIALRRVLDMDVGVLSGRERSELEDVLSQLDIALDTR